MSDSKLNVLVLYACSEYPFRKTFKSFIESFEKYSDHNIHYCNFPFYFPKKALSLVHWDVIIYTHSFTAPWNRERYLKKIQRIESLKLKAQRKIALFQDEYFNSDLTNLFIKKLDINHVYTVAPESEWSKIYPEVPKHKLTQYLTGYIDEQDIQPALDLISRTKKSIDISYRTAYPGPQMAALGDVGWLKFEIADFGNQLGLLNSDIQVGTGFLIGDGWFKLLAQSVFTLGVPSGSNILDTKGTLSEILCKNRNFSRDKIQILLKELDIKQDYKLEVISPRIFEAGLFDCCQILVEGEYNGILVKNKHYISINRNLDNIEEVKKTISDLSKRSEIVMNFRRDIIENPSYRYRTFVKSFFDRIELKNETSHSSMLSAVAFLMKLHHIFFIIIMKSGLIKILKK